ncbi:MAG TPA: site-specific integrase [Candidatus Hydrogenedentes bacterium]|nr:site-specific integrase [Candidatus Hydrogenedentota bacterium]HQM50370.1 site-specific integrase [Candidatus Hydrogenedentota bacterium]
MQIELNNKVIEKLQPEEKPLKVFDTTVPGFHLRIQPSGYRCYYVEYRKLDGKKATYNVGSAELITLGQARKKAKEFLANRTLGKDLAEHRRQLRVHTLKSYLDDHYRLWVSAHRKTGEQTIYMVEKYFASFLNSPIGAIERAEIEKWRYREIKRGAKRTSINRRVAALRSVLTRALKDGVIPFHPLRDMEKLPEIDSQPIIRYLSQEERVRLMAALDEREEELREQRDSGNAWRRERGYAELPDLRAVEYADYMKPLVIVALATGLRRSELFSLRWSEVDFEAEIVTVRREVSKSKRERYVEMLGDSYEVLKAWRRQTPGEFVFPGDDGSPFTTVQKSWKTLIKKAQIKNFRFHDCRHDFASQLAMAGVDLYEICKLMGHSSVTVTEKYAHLCPARTSAKLAEFKAPKRTDNIVPFTKPMEA